MHKAILGRPRFTPCAPPNMCTAEISPPKMCTAKMCDSRGPREGPQANCPLPTVRQRVCWLGVLVVPGPTSPAPSVRSDPNRSEVRSSRSRLHFPQAKGPAEPRPNQSAGGRASPFSVPSAELTLSIHVPHPTPFVLHCTLKLLRGTWKCECLKKCGKN